MAKEKSDGRRLGSSLLVVITPGTLRHPRLKGLGGGGFGGFVGLGGDGVRGVGGFYVGLDVVVDTLHAFFEAAEPFTETLAKLGQLFAAEEKDGEACQDDEVPRLK